MKRRNFLAAAIAAATSPRTLAALAAEKPPPAPEPPARPPYRVLFRADGRQFVYRIPGMLVVGNTVLVVCNEQQSKTQSDANVVAGVLRRSTN